jgi:cytochrome b subunit of formate dehydrogenase
MIGSFVTLVVTGWPLRAAAVGASSALAGALGGQAVLAVIHRIAGAVLILDGLYHLGYLAWLYRRGKLTFQMVPGLRDARDLVHNVLYLVGLRRERPRFGRWAYHEKFDYWAVFWGMVIMGCSGLVLWFPEVVARFLPGQFVELSYIAHGDEAVLAAAAIFVWHFYNVHLRPTVFPMSWVWLTGRISAEALYEEHRAEYEARFGSAPPRPEPGAEGAWPRRPIWSFLALALVVVAAVGVVAGDVSSIRAELRSISENGHAGTPRVEAAALVVVEGEEDGAQKEPEMFQRCFACHTKERFEAGRGFPHRMHFEENDVDDTCTGCHRAKWHESMSLDTESCLECHEAEEIGLRP